MSKSYVLDRTDVNLFALKKQGWKSVRELPSVNSYQEVLLIKEKHGGDLEVITASWMPINGYTAGEFQQRHYVIDNSSIYLWRSLDFLVEEK